MRLIDADELNKTLGIDSDSCSTCSWGYRGRCSRGCDFEDACCAIEDAPAIDPVKHGRWEKDEKASKDHFEQIFICSNCHNMEAWGWTEVDTYKYCPNCGAKMDEVEK